MSDKKRYHRLKAKGLCVRCGKKKEPGDGTLCDACRRMKNEDGRKNTQLLRELKICTKCKKTKVYGNELRCPECRAKDSEYRKAYRQKNRDRIREMDRKRSHKNKAEWRAKGLCTYCGKRKPKHGNALCDKCLVKRRANSNSNYKKIHPIDRREWVDHGWCYRCGEPALKDKRLCEKCYKQNIINAEKATHSKHHWWIDDNQSIFQKGGNNHAPQIKATS